jgi:predicted DNA-binding transcriptional regulator AlpA
MNADAQPKDLITLSEASRLLGVSRPKMSRLVANGKLTIFPDPLDDRAKLVSRQDVLALQVRARAA